MGGIAQYGFEYYLTGFAMASAQYQRERRAMLKRRGYKRLDIEISPQLWAKLKPHLSSDAECYPGAALVEFLENLEIFPE